MFVFKYNLDNKTGENYDIAIVGSAQESLPNFAN